MEKLTLKERDGVRKAIRTDEKAWKLYSSLRNLLKHRSSDDDCSAYPYTVQAVRIYEDERCKRFMRIAHKEAKKSKCARRKVGAVLEKDGDVVGKGHNGVPYDLIECTSEVPCFKVNHDIKSGSFVDQKDCRAMHGEEAAIVSAAKKGKSTVGATLFTTHQPCLGCVLQLIAAGINEVYYEEPYPDGMALTLLKKADIEIHQTGRSTS